MKTFLSEQMQWLENWDWKEPKKAQKNKHTESITDNVCLVVCSLASPLLCFSQLSQKPVWKYLKANLSSPVSQMYWTALASCLCRILASSSLRAGDSVRLKGFWVGLSVWRHKGTTIKGASEGHCSTCWVLLWMMELVAGVEPKNGGCTNSSQLLTPRQQRFHAHLWANFTLHEQYANMKHTQDPLPIRHQHQQLIPLTVLVWLPHALIPQRSIKGYLTEYLTCSKALCTNCQKHTRTVLE